MFTGGAFVGAFFGGPSGDFLGRRKTIALGCLVFLFGGALQTGAPTLSCMWAGRWFAGIGVGILTMIIPMYQAELGEHPLFFCNQGGLNNCTWDAGATHMRKHIDELVYSTPFDSRKNHCSSAIHAGGWIIVRNLVRRSEGTRILVGSTKGRVSLTTCI